MFQIYLYDALDDIERAHLHAQVGRSPETLYTGHPDALAEISPHLARHFQRAGLADKAVAYRHQAGERAMRLWANEEAIRHLTAGLALLQTLPETPARIQRELSMQLALTVPLQAIQSYGAPEVGHAYARAHELALHTSLGDSLQQALTLAMIGQYYLFQAEYHTALELCERAAAMARRLGDPAWVTALQCLRGLILTFTGEFAQGLAHLKAMIDLCDPQQHRPMTFAIGQDLGTSAHAWASWAQWFLGYPDRALGHSQMALSLARASEHPFSICFAHGSAGFLFHLLRREVAQARRHVELAESLAAAEGFAFHLTDAKVIGGWLRAEGGQAEAGITRMREGLAAREETGAQMFKPLFLGLLAEACGWAGHVEEGLKHVTQALEIVDRTGEHFYAAELHRLRGHLLAQSGTADEAEVAACYQRAIDVARRQDAWSLELRAATSLARLWQAQGRIDDARQMLGEIYGWFTEGFDTPDLREAKALLEELA